MAASPSLVSLLVLFVTVTVESRPSPQSNDMQVLNSLFGAQLSSLIVAPPPSNDITEGSAGHPAPSTSGGAAPSQGAAWRLAGGQEVMPRLLLDFVRQRSKMRRRNRKSMVGGGRGCFGMKMDRIGSISGLGC